MDLRQLPSCAFMDCNRVELERLCIHGLDPAPAHEKMVFPCYIEHALAGAADFPRYTHPGTLECNGGYQNTR
jgi:hypothetical protein